MFLIQKLIKQYYYIVMLLIMLLRFLYTFVPHKSFGQLLDIFPKNFIFIKIFDSDFSYIEVWFTDQNSNPLEIEDKINITLVIN